MQLISSWETSASCFGAHRWTPGPAEKLLSFLPVLLSDQTPQSSVPLETICTTRQYMLSGKASLECSLEKELKEKQNHGMTKGDRRIIKVQCLLKLT